MLPLYDNPCTGCKSAGWALLCAGVCEDYDRRLVAKLGAVQTFTTLVPDWSSSCCTAATMHFVMHTGCCCAAQGYLEQVRPANDAFFHRTMSGASSTPSECEFRRPM